MANPQCEDGYTKIANEIMEALAKIRISGEARQMLDVIIRKTYGFNKKEDKIATVQFMELTGLSRLAIPKARKKLISLNLITVSQKGYSQILTYSFQKNYEKWKPYPKKYTVSKKGGGVYTKKDTKCIPKSSTQKKKETITKEHFLDFVLLTKEEYTKLVAQFGQLGTDERIKSLNLYIGSKGDKYKSHYHTILNWEQKNLLKQEYHAP